MGEAQVGTDGSSLPGPSRDAGKSPSSPNGTGESHRVPLACLTCRSKRIRCTGKRPNCEACIKAGAECEWPVARAKKRTKKEMEEARRLERNGEAVMFETGEAASRLGQPMQLTGQDQQHTSSSDHNIPSDPLDPWTIASHTYSSNYLWPTDFTLSVPDLPSTAPTDSKGQYCSSQDAAQSLTSNLPTNDMGLGSAFNIPDGQVGAASSGVGSLRDFDSTFGNQWSPSTDLRLADVLNNHTAFINGNPEEDKDLELYYYRFSGSTAIHPGINRIGLKLQRRNASSPIAAAPQPGNDTPTHPIIPSADLFDSSGMPHTHVWQPLFNLFFKHMSQHFPSCSRQRMMERFETGTMSQFLACCICSLGARFIPETIDHAQAAAPFIAKAQELAMPLLQFPTYDVVTGLLYLAWNNYGQSSESGLWQYSGMAIRMSIDLGVHEVSEIYESPAHVIRTRLLFWQLFITDRIVAFATGRPASIPEDIVEIPLPSDEDFFPDPARNLADSPIEQVEPVPFVQLVKLMIICGRISNVLNGRRGKARTLVSTNEPLPELLAELQVRLVTFYSTLPETLRWSANNFKHQHARGHSGTFLALHLWANAVLALVYHPELLKSPSGIETPLNRSMSRNVALSLAASRRVCECMVFADLVDSLSYTSTPYLGQPLFVGAMAFIHEMRSLQASAVETISSNPTDVLMSSMAKQNFTALLNAAHKMEDYWAGVNYMVSILEKRSGIFRTGERALKTFISLPDTGILKRFATDREHPQNVAPPTETSLRESIARTERSSSISASGATPLWLADLMSDYTVQNMSFAPANTSELERLLTRAATASSQGNTGGL
ncbi:fungal-specific transcription factor domain-domain-containing protein [Naematelia encephala]|uniref:Fungal-specific transcription factor domain-domain-containing protein n=1 Tax=Naematelia encephala TaxID=71784 RepID=A0A1Y2AUR5_9TREE|nr:fungal-specific transcription factor domain-domain-containing protein [Naematelia encephala]